MRYNLENSGLFTSAEKNAEVILQFQSLPWQSLTVPSIYVILYFQLEKVYTNLTQISHIN